MKKNRLSLLSLFAIGTFFSVMAQTTTEWEYQGEKEGIEVYFREPVDSDLKQLKMTMFFDAPLSTIVAALEDVEAIPEWVYKVTEASIIKEVSPTEYYYYNRLDFPWPLSDRDLICRSTFQQDPKTKVAIYTSTGVHDMLPIRKEEDIVRIKEVNIKWVFTPQVDGRLKLDYYLSSDPAGDIPSWIVNLAVDHGPVKTMTAFRTLLKKEKYQNQQFVHVKD